MVGVPISDSLRSSSNRVRGFRFCVALDRRAVGVRRVLASSSMADAIEQGDAWVVG